MPIKPIDASARTRLPAKTIGLPSGSCCIKPSNIETWGLFWSTVFHRHHCGYWSRKTEIATSSSNCNQAFPLKQVIINHPRPHFQYHLRTDPANSVVIIRDGCCSKHKDSLQGCTHLVQAIHWYWGTSKIVYFQCSISSCWNAELFLDFILS